MEKARKITFSLLHLSVLTILFSPEDMFLVLHEQMYTVMKQ